MSIEEFQLEAITRGNFDFAVVHRAGTSSALNLLSKYQNPNVFIGSDCPYFYGAKVVIFYLRGA
jgi:hypothetical protein